MVRSTYHSHCHRRWRWHIPRYIASSSFFNGIFQSTIYYPHPASQIFNLTWINLVKKQNWKLNNIIKKFRTLPTIRAKDYVVDWGLACEGAGSIIKCIAVGSWTSSLEDPGIERRPARCRVGELPGAAVLVEPERPARALARHHAATFAPLAPDHLELFRATCEFILVNFVRKLITKIWTFYPVRYYMYLVDKVK